MRIEFTHKNPSSLLIQFLIVTFILAFFFFLRYRISESEDPWPIAIFLAESLVVMALFVGCFLYYFSAAVLEYVRSPGQSKIILNDDKLKINEKPYELSDTRFVVEKSITEFTSREYRYCLVILNKKKVIFSSKPYYQNYKKDDLMKMLYNFENIKVEEH